MRFPLPENIISVISRLEDRGFEAFVVGGCVRDLCRSVVPHDYDVTTSATPEETKECFSDHRVIETGIKHGTVTVISDSEPVEITTFRSDGAYSDNRHPDSVTFTSDIELDLSRRDFTVNAMAYSPSRGLYDIFGGEDDLRRRRIRCVGEPELRFGEDGLRILRALRFASVLDFEIDAETSTAVHGMYRLLENISVERIYSELCRLICGDGAVRILSEYRDVITSFLPLSADSYDDAVSSMRSSRPDRLLRLSLLLPTTDAASSLAKLKPDGYTLRYITKTAEISSQLPTDPPSVRRLLRYTPPEILYTAIENARLRRLIGDDEALHIADTVTDAKSKPCTPSELSITGDDIIALGVERGRDVGLVLESLLDDVISDRLENTHDALTEAAAHIISKKIL